ncbi:enoyl-CoA hydratase/isomerase family protein [Pseudoroseomonas cervicalis]|uniref:enoyl-CoA hydratase/isomerase family protein n=1 Tax=Teichococcus cervicalis TaxID=204525 RepID=UPI0035E9DE54
MTPNSAASDAILLQADGPVAVLTLNRPAARNAIDDAMRADLMAALDHVARTDSIKALVVTGAGQGFCAGGDVKSMQARLAVPPGEVALNGWRRQQRTRITPSPCCTPCRSPPSPPSMARRPASAAMSRCAATSSSPPTRRASP